MEQYLHQIGVINVEFYVLLTISQRQYFIVKNMMNVIIIHIQIIVFVVILVNLVSLMIIKNIMIVMELFVVYVKDKYLKKMILYFVLQVIIMHFTVIALINFVVKLKVYK